MYLRIVLYSAFLLTVGSCFYAPVNSVAPVEFKEKYLKFKNPGEVFEEYNYNYLITKKKDGEKVFRQFYPEKNQLILEYHTIPVSAYKTKMEGLYRSWWDDGRLKLEGTMEHDKRVGEWKFYDFDEGHLSRIDSFYRGEIVKQKNYYSSGVVASIFEYSDNKKNGAFSEFDSLGVLMNQGVYRADSLVSESNPLSSRGDSLIKEKLPRFPGCEDISDEEQKNICSNRKLLKYIYGNLKYPVRARKYGVEGEVVTRFTIDTTGNVRDIAFLQGICYPMESAIHNIISSMPKWIPAEQNGEKVQVRFTLPVKFKLIN